MTIFFDHQTFSLQNYGGISRYYSELISGINQYSNHHAYLPPLYSNNVYLNEKSFDIKPFLPNRPFLKREALLYRFNKLRTIPLIRNNDYNIFHATYYDPYFISHIKNRPFVVTFLDMIHEKFSGQYKELAFDKIITDRKRLVAQKADRIISISQSTKRDIVELLDINPEKIEVIYLGNSLTRHEIRQEELNSTEKAYLLFVGNRSHYKNFRGLLTAIHPLLKQHNLKLLCAGGGGFTETEKNFISSLSAEKVVEQRPINDKSLIVLYQQALAFIFPSFYEGFGIPVLEAFACNCPCIVSNSSSLPEVAGNAALYIDPNEPESMFNAVEKLIYNSNLRDTLRSKGRDQLANFSWEHTVKSTLTLYESVLSTRTNALS